MMRPMDSKPGTKTTEDKARCLLYLDENDATPRRLYPYEKSACLSLERGDAGDEANKLGEIVQFAYDEFKGDDLMSKPAPALVFGRECFCCGAGMEPSMGIDKGDSPREAPLSPPNGGTIWESSGNYGSTVWDPTGPNDDALNIMVCDGCLKERSARVRFVRRNRKVEVLVQRPWDKEKD
jgi:hypothetical protein